MLSRSTIQLSPVTPQSGEKRCKNGCFLSLHFGVICCEVADNWTVFIHIFQRVGPRCWSELAKVNLAHELPSLLRRMLAPVPPEWHSRADILSGLSLSPCRCRQGRECLGRGVQAQRDWNIQMRKQSLMGLGLFLQRQLDSTFHFFLVSLPRRGPDAKTGWAQMAKFPFFLPLRANFSYTIRHLITITAWLWLSSAPLIQVSQAPVHGEPGSAGQPTSTLWLAFSPSTRATLSS